MLPPVQVGVATVHVPALPLMVNPPLPAAVPVLFSTMPLDAPFEEMLRKVKPLEPIEVLTTLSAMPVVETMTLGEVDALPVVYVID